MPNNQELMNLVNSNAKRQQILDAAYVIFSRRGYHRATVDDIIALADTGKGTVYKYFGNKEHLFYTLIKERNASFEIILAEIVRSKEPSLDTVKTMIKILMQFCVANGDLWWDMICEVRRLGIEVNSCFMQEQRNKYQELFSQIIGMLEKVLQEGIDRGVLRNIDSNKVANCLFSVVVLTVSKSINEDIDVTANMIADSFLYGVACRQHL